VLSNLLHPPPARRGDLVLVPGVSSETLDRLEHVPATGCGKRMPRAHGSLGVQRRFRLARAGLLDGRRCTTHWKVTDRLRAEYPQAIVIDNRLFVEDGGVITSAESPPASTWRWPWSKRTTGRSSCRGSRAR